jgi:hypothetical protein
MCQCARTYRPGSDEHLTSVSWKKRYRAPEYSLEVSMNLHLTIGPLVSLVAGILILVVPRLLNYIVAIYLIVIGLLGLFGSGSLHLQ